MQGIEQRFTLVGVNIGLQSHKRCIVKLLGDPEHLDRTLIPGINATRKTKDYTLSANMRRHE